jgi:hypothetical protein
MSLIEQIAGLALIIVPMLLILYMPVGMLCSKTKKQLMPDTGFSVQVYIPFINLLYLRKILNGSTLMAKIPTVILLVAALFRVASLLLLTVYPVLVIYSAALILLAIVIYYIFYIIIALDVAHTLGSSLMTYIVCIVVAPLAYYLLSLRVTAYLSSYKEVLDGTFEGE